MVVDVYICIFSLVFDIITVTKMATQLQSLYKERYRAFNSAHRAIKSAQALYGRRIPPQIASQLKRDWTIATLNLSLIVRSVAADKNRMGSANTIHDNASLRRNIERSREEEDAYKDALSSDIDDSIATVARHKEDTDDINAEISELTEELMAILSTRI